MHPFSPFWKFLDALLLLLTLPRDWYDMCSEVQDPFSIIN